MTTPSEPSLVQLWLHGGLDLSEQLQKEPPECPAENVSAHPTPRRDRTLVERLGRVNAGCLLCFEPYDRFEQSKDVHSSRNAGRC